MTRRASLTPNSRSVIGRWSLLVLLLLLAWGLRLCCLETVPPGWRDDELINIHALSGELFTGNFPLYFMGASGHEPLYHYLHAGVHALFGFNIVSGHFLSVALGTLSIALTYTVARYLFDHSTAFIASLAMTTSFWSLMYSRTAIRHISLPPCALITFYLLWRSLSRESGALTRSWLLVGLATGISVYTYPAARLLPVLLILLTAYLAMFHRGRFQRCWRGVLLSLVTAAAVAAPMAIAILQGRTEAAVEGIGADARLAELAVPLRELQAGNLRPLLETSAKTLGMFFATGDPEWLYNIPGRPVFNLLGGVLLWVGVVLCLYRWRRPQYSFLILWLGLGLLPAFVSTPPASLSHTILAQPVAYILPTLVLTQAQHRIRGRATGVLDPASNTRLPDTLLSLVRALPAILLVVFLTTNVARDLRDYFITWPQRGMVRFLYRADYREASHYLNAHSEISDVAISSALMGPWDRLALDVDTRGLRTIRLFNPERALVWVASDSSPLVLLTQFPRPATPIDAILGAATNSTQVLSPHLALHDIIGRAGFGSERVMARFANGLDLTDVRWTERGGRSLTPGQETVLLTTWHVARPLHLPPISIVANPPPPGVRPDPRLAMFAHFLTADAILIMADDGLWVDPVTLQPGDRFIQIHRFMLPSDLPSGPYSVGLGLYDPVTEDQWLIVESEDRVPRGSTRLLIPVDEIEDIEEEKQ